MSSNEATWYADVSKTNIMDTYAEFGIAIDKLPLGPYRKDGISGQMYSLESPAAKAVLYKPDNLIFLKDGFNPPTVHQQFIVINTDESQLTPELTVALLQRCGLDPKNGHYLGMDQYAPTDRQDDPTKASFTCTRQNHPDDPNKFQWVIETKETHPLGQPFN